MYGKYAKALAFLAIAFLLTWNPGALLKTGGQDYHTKDEIKFTFEKTDGNLPATTSGSRVIEEKYIQKLRIGNISKGDYEILCRIVQAEAGGEDNLGKRMVADVIINRVNSPKFPNTVQGVVFQGEGGKPQFSPVRDGRYYSVIVTKETKAAVSEAIQGDDSTGGALYFVNADKANPENYAWFEQSLSFRKEHGGHRFYR